MKFLDGDNMKTLHYFWIVNIFGILVLNDLHAQWKQTGGPLTEVSYSLAVIDSFVYAGSYLGGVYRSSDNGDSWIQIDGGNFPIDTGFSSTNITSIAVCVVNEDTSIFAGTEGQGIFHSTNNGTNWTQKNVGLTNTSINAIVIDSNNISLFTQGGVFFSTNNGENWIPSNEELRGYWGFVVGRNANEDTILIKLDGGDVLRSTDNGINWNRVTSSWPSGTLIISLAVRDTIFFAATSEHGIYYSLDGGLTWVSSGWVTVGVVKNLAGNSQYLFAATGTPTIYTGSVWRRPIAEMLVSVNQRENTHPLKYILEQNYPNPFNPATTIGYQIPYDGIVTIKIYDALGREVQVLADEFKTSGYYTIRFDASRLSTGMYMVKIVSGDFLAVKKMILVK
jgi:photosystem II stability/assembly factor-like uncharacterized protein